MANRDISVGHFFRKGRLYLHRLGLKYTMNPMNDLRTELIKEIERLGFPTALGEAVAKNLGSEKTMSRMLGYLKNVKPDKEELIVDEMLAIMEDRKRWIDKKEAEYSNARYNDILNNGIG